MRTRIGGVAAVALVMAVGACSGGGSAVEFTAPQGHEGTVPFTATGTAVDDAVVCGTGTTVVDHLESMDGARITDEDWAGMFDSAEADGGVAEMKVLWQFECEDGTGGFAMTFHNRFDFATFEFEGRQDVGTWVIEEGTGDYGGLSGSGDATLDWDAEQITWSGEVTND
jgi:hypothetical protein